MQQTASRKKSLVDTTYYLVENVENVYLGK